MLARILIKAWGILKSDIELIKCNFSPLIDAYHSPLVKIVGPLKEKRMRICEAGGSCFLIAILHVHPSSLFSILSYNRTSLMKMKMVIIAYAMHA